MPFLLQASGFKPCKSRELFRIPDLFIDDGTQSQNIAGLAEHGHGHGHG
jgi:hypothetical protein